MKIAYLTASLRPHTGAGEFTRELMDAVGRHKPDTQFVTLSADDLLAPGIGRILSNWFKILSKLRTADLIHALDGYPYGVLAAAANLFLSKPLVITAVGSGSIQLLRKRDWRSMLLRFAYRRATVVTAISRYTAEELRKHTPGLSVEVINHGVDAKFYSHLESRKEVVPDSPYILSVGEFKRRKGYSEILPILKKVFETQPELQYVILADKKRNLPYQEELYKLMDDLGIRGNVRVLSGLSNEDKRALYQNAKIYLSLPKDDSGDVEGFGLAILEAAASGLPAIVGKGSGADDAVLDDKSGFLVDGENPEEVVERITEMLNNEDLRRRISDGAREWAREMDWSKQALRYIEIYESRTKPY